MISSDATQARQHSDSDEFGQIRLFHWGYRFHSLLNSVSTGLGYHRVAVGRGLSVGRLSVRSTGRSQLVTKFWVIQKYLLYLSRKLLRHISLPQLDLIDRNVILLLNARRAAAIADIFFELGHECFNDLRFLPVEIVLLTGVLF
ncbi:hypothetical protein Pla100_54010 [Neorhodopirellula pilleata]|uniref:Transposase DDE domain-containing protein n=1 Tax=Neorhodopirellula pilleata TaxID=2714738 RepID=A0A5C5ZW30_9BACT|nr:hypothetical protein Pla100_54010 [Neorhodopirellula pilleata]